MANRIITFLCVRIPSLIFFANDLQTKNPVQFGSVGAELLQWFQEARILQDPWKIELDFMPFKIHREQV